MTAERRFQYQIEWQIEWQRSGGAGFVRSPFPSGVAGCPGIVWLLIVREAATHSDQPRGDAMACSALIACHLPGDESYDERESPGG